MKRLSVETPASRVSTPANPFVFVPHNSVPEHLSKLESKGLPSNMRGMAAVTALSVLTPRSSRVYFPRLNSCCSVASCDEQEVSTVAWVRTDSGLGSIGIYPDPGICPLWCAFQVIIMSVSTFALKMLQSLIDTIDTIFIHSILELK